MKRAALLLAGGAGTRLWPLSSDDDPKQFLPLFDGKSLLRRTYERVADLDVFVSTNERYRQKVLRDIPELDPARVIAEPSRRNTAPALALSCFEIAGQLGEETVIAALPSDHFIEDEKEFRRVIDRAFAYASTHDALVTIAIDPTEPNTGYGYLELGEEVEAGIVELRRFVEKPDLTRATEFLAAGNYAWNGGMFIWRASVFREQLRRFAPDLAAVTRARYEEAPAISIDYALMEKAHPVVAASGDFGWSDVGSWAAVSRLSGRGNAQLEVVNGSNVFAHGQLAGRRVITIGVSNVAVVESDEGILVIDLAQAERLSSVIARMKK